MATRLVSLTYLQHWDPANNELTLRLLLLPRGNPLDPLTTNAPNFPTAKFAFDVHLQSGLDNFPTPTGSAALVTIPSPVVTTACLYSKLSASNSLLILTPLEQRDLRLHMSRSISRRHTSRQSATLLAAPNSFSLVANIPVFSRHQVHSHHIKSSQPQIPKFPGKSDRLCHAQLQVR
jgi:hypothetical protein